MSRLASNSLKWGLSLLFCLVVFLFWWLRFPQALAFQEQFQLFLFSGDYLASRLAEPGGVARYVAEFLVQFYNNVVAGAAIIAILLMLQQRLVWRLMHSACGAWYPLSFLPSILLWLLMGDESVLLTTVTSLLIVTAAMLLTPGKSWARLGYAIVAIPLAYWLAGPLALLLALYIPFRQTPEGDSPAFRIVASGVVADILLFYFCLTASTYFLPYPFLRLAFGLGYYRYVEVLPYLLVAVALVVLLLAVCGRWLPILRGRKAWLIATGQVVFLTALLVTALPGSYERRKYDLMEYDYLVRANRWDAIVEKSTLQQPDLPMSVCATNLALAMRGELGDRAFDFYQNGSHGLLPPFERNYASLMLTGEAYFQLGLVNTAQRFAFEAMEAIPNYNKSARAVKRLVETNLVNGQYRVAAKYINMLKKTVFYRNWAQRMEQLMTDEKAIDAHPVYGNLRRLRLKEDFLFSERELDKVCGQLFIHNNENTLARQYLILFPLLQGDVDKFMSYAQVVQEKAGYNPRASQEAIAYAFMQKGQMPPAGLVPPVTVQRLREFVSAYKTAGKNSPQVQRFKNTVWYYLTGGE